MYVACAPGTIGFSLTFKECAETVAAIGYEGFWFDISQDSALSVAETKDLLSRYKIRPAGFGLPVNVRADKETFKDALEKLKGYAHFAQEVGLDRTITWIAPGSDTLEYKEQWELYRSRLKELVPVLGEYGISLGLEFVGTPSFRRPSKYQFIHNLDGTLELIGAVGEPNLGLLLDVWHWDMAGQTSEDFKKIKSEQQIVLVHLNDAPAGLSPDEQTDTVRCLPGSTGVLRTAEFIRGVASFNYNGPAVVEPFYPALAKMPFAEAAKMVYDSAKKVL